MVSFEIKQVSQTSPQEFMACDLGLYPCLYVLGESRLLSLAL